MASDTIQTSFSVTVPTYNVVVAKPNQLVAQFGTGKAGQYVACSTTWQQLPLGSVTSPSYCVMQTLSTDTATTGSAFIQFGATSGVPFGELLPSDPPALLRLSRSLTGSVWVRSTSGTIGMTYEIFQL